MKNFTPLECQDTSLAQALQRITLALGQMRGKGMVSGQEMAQLVEAGVLAWEFLAKTLGTTVADAIDMVERRMVPAAVGI